MKTFRQIANNSFFFYLVKNPKIPNVLFESHSFDFPRRKVLIITSPH